MKEPPTQITDSPHEALESTARGGRCRERLLLWVDGVGGFLICQSPRVLLGHAAPDSDIDVPILADVSRHHAWLERDAQGYFVEAIRSVQINHRAVGQTFQSAMTRRQAGKPAPLDQHAPPPHRPGGEGAKGLLRSGDLLTLGRSCQFSFTQAVPVSASARLDLVSGHRLWRALHGVLLMAETLVLGPGPAVHVQVPDLLHALVLFRYKSGLAVRYPGKLWINDRPAGDGVARALLPVDSDGKITVDDISLTLERIGGP